MIVITLCLLYREHIKWQDKKKLLPNIFQSLLTEKRESTICHQKRWFVLALILRSVTLLVKCTTVIRGILKDCHCCCCCCCFLTILNHTSRRWVLNGSVIAQLLSHVQLFATPWTPAHQVPLSMGFPRQEYWSGLSLPSLEAFLDPGIKSLFPALAGRFVTTETPGKPKQQYTPPKTSLIRNKKIFLFARENGDLTCK